MRVKIALSLSRQQSRWTLKEHFAFHKIKVVLKGRFYKIICIQRTLNILIVAHSEIAIGNNDSNKQLLMDQHADKKQLNTKFPC